jgi:Smg protein
MVRAALFGEDAPRYSGVMAWRGVIDASKLPAHMREIVIDRAMAVPQRPIDIDDLKIIVLMVYWSAGIEPDALVLDELCDDNHSRVAH